MSHKLLVQLFSLLPAGVLLVTITGAGLALADGAAVISDLECAVTDPVSILVVPDGTGAPFMSSRTIEGDVVDATIRVQLMAWDENGPMGLVGPGYPFEDIWLEATDDHSRGCERYPVAMADGPTDEESWATFTLPPRSGGWTQGVVDVYVAGQPGSAGPYDIPSLPISFNSPDISADGVVNLTDIVYFTGDLVAADAPFRSDLVWDGVINLSDIAVFTGYIGVDCP